MKRLMKFSVLFLLLLLFVYVFKQGGLTEEERGSIEFDYDYPDWQSSMVESV